MEKILIVGIDTLAGSNLAVALAGEQQVIGISERESFSLSNCQVITADTFDAARLRDRIMIEQPQWAIYCGAASQSSWDWRDDVDGVAESNRIAAAAGAMAALDRRLTLISTDAVFHGPHLFARESFLPSDRPISAAIRRMEQAAGGSGALIVRTHLFGWSPSGDSCAENIWESIAAGQSVVASGSRYASPMLATDFSSLLWQAMRKGLAGLYHLAGAERVSMWQFVQIMAEHARADSTDHATLQTQGLQPLGLARDPSLIGTEIAAQCEETSLDSRQIQRLLRTPLPRLREGISRFTGQAKSEHRDQLRGTDPLHRRSIAA